MKVKSKKDTKKLIKGHVYETDFFNNDPTNRNYQNRFLFKRISIKDRGTFIVDNFTLVDGNPLPSIIYDKREPKSILKNFNDLKIGDVIVCLSDNRFKYLIEGGKYKIESIDHSKYSFKLEGYNRYLTWSNWNFRALTTQEMRDLTLSQIFDKEENFSVDFKRKFELKSNKDHLLIQTLAKSINDKNRHDLSVLDWAIKKNGEHLKIKEEDFKDLLDKPLKEILEILDNFEKE
jgi:hypothetical protein